MLNTTQMVWMVGDELYNGGGGDSFMLEGVDEDGSEDDEVCGR